MAKYKAGDKVRVKDHRVNGKNIFWSPYMDKMFGKIVTIKCVLGDGTYHIEEMEFSWCDEMFEGLADTTGNEVIDLLMEKLGVKVNEKFEINGGYYNPYYFDEIGNIRGISGYKGNSWLSELIHGAVKIKKIPKPEIKEMTIEEIEKELKLQKGSLRVKGGD